MIFLNKNSICVQQKSVNHAGLEWHKVENIREFLFLGELFLKEKQEVGVYRLSRFPRTEGEIVREVFFVNSVRAQCWMSVNWCYRQTVNVDTWVCADIE